MATDGTLGVKEIVRFVASMSTHVEPLLPVSWYCRELQFANQCVEVVLLHVGGLKLKPLTLAPCGTNMNPPSSAREPKRLEPPPRATLTRCVPLAGSNP